MHTALWIVTAIVATGFAIGGISQVVLTKERFRSFGASQHWVDDFGRGHIKAIGTIKIIGSLGLILPAVLDVAVVLVPLAASGLMLVMAGAGTTRFRRSEWGYLLGDLMFIGLLGFVAWGRFALEPLG
ncbi:DoxX-like family protein [Micromonospora echinaurantiaca]|uniref:DoxX-like family protein n=1 Tax=Micromonospora echinaurantiaca TaxID=47857 RepID=A0A1C5I1I4_9ACTN|nr:DoxX family protein [Micromonospora echinaurantiaca]SCG52128.1 DoxX-like family protein [Micromonospora echinaurantiaca]